MKKRYLFFGALLLNGFVLQAQHHLSGCDRGSIINVGNPCWNYPYILVFEDNFDGSSLDETKWGLKWPPGSPYWSPDVEVQEYNTLENVSVSNGQAIISAKYEPGYRMQAPGNGPNNTTLQNGTDGAANYRNFNYTSSSLWSNYIFRTGYFEMVCQVPTQPGYWPAFWMYNEEDGVNNELDIFEMWDNNASDVNLTIHNGQQCGKKYNLGVNYGAGPHKFAALWDDWKITWLIDNYAVQYTYKWYVPGTLVGVTCEDVENYGPLQLSLNSAFPKSPMQLIFNLALRLGYPEPSAMSVDYVRFYQARANCNTIKTYGTNGVLGLDSDELIVDEYNKPYYHHETGSIINVNGNITLLHNIGSTQIPQQLKLTAAEEFNFNLDPVTGLPVSNPSVIFDIEPGAIFEAIIDPYVCSNSPQLPINNVIGEAPDQMMEGLANQNENGTLGLANDIFKLEKVSISPNPTNQDVVTLISSERTKVVITNSLGRKVKEIEVQAGENQLNIENLSSGVYQLYFESLKETVKLVKL